MRSFRWNIKLFLQNIVFRKLHFKLYFKTYKSLNYKRMRRNWEEWKGTSHVWFSSFLLTIIIATSSLEEIQGRIDRSSAPLLSGGLLKFSFVRLNTEWLIASCGFTSLPNSGHVRESFVFTSRYADYAAARSSPFLHYAYLASALWRNRLMTPAECVVTFLVAPRKIWMLLSERWDIRDAEKRRNLKTCWKVLSITGHDHSTRGSRARYNFNDREIEHISIKNISRVYS